MNNKDRFAVVVTVLALFFSGLFAIGDEGVSFVIASVAVVLYWAYRFIKNDISFLKIKDA